MLSFVGVLAYASFPVEISALIVTDPEKFKLDTLGFILGILTTWLLPYSLLLLLIQKKNFKGSLAWGWLTGFVLTIVIVILVFALPEFRFIY